MLSWEVKDVQFFVCILLAICSQTGQTKGKGGIKENETKMEEQEVGSGRETQRGREKAAEVGRERGGGEVERKTDRGRERAQSGELVEKK